MSLRRSIRKMEKTSSKKKHQILENKGQSTEVNANIQDQLDKVHGKTLSVCSTILSPQVSLEAKKSSSEDSRIQPAKLNIQEEEALEEKN